MKKLGNFLKGIFTSPNTGNVVGKISDNKTVGNRNKLILIGLVVLLIALGLLPESFLDKVLDLF